MCPGSRTRDRIKDLEAAIEQLEGILDAQKLNSSEIISIQKYVDRLQHELSYLKNLPIVHKDYSN